MSNGSRYGADRLHFYMMAVGETAESQSGLFYRRFSGPWAVLITARNSLRGMT